MTTSIDTTANLEATYFQPTSEAQDSNFQEHIEEILQSIIQSLAQQMQQSGLQGGMSGAQGAQDTGDTSSGGSGMNAQGASGALASYMNDNGISSLNPDQLYQIAYNPAAGTSPTVSAAAKYMLVHSSTFNAIETHDVAGADGIAGANDFKWAAEGGLSSASQSGQARGTGQTGGPAMTAQSASGALAAYMSQNNTNLLDVNGLYQIAYNPSAGTSATVSAAAKYMLQHPDTFNKIETNDWTATDGIANTIQFDWAAEGDLDTANKSA